MIQIKFKVPIYDWNIQAIKIESDSDTEKLKKILKNFKVKDKYIKQTINKATGKYTGGECYYDLSRQKGIIIIFQASGINTLLHEKRHIEDHILDHHQINDLEAAAYLSGYIGEKMTKILKNILK